MTKSPQNILLNISFSLVMIPSRYIRTTPFQYKTCGVTYFINWCLLLINDTYRSSKYIRLQFTENICMCHNIRLGMSSFVCKGRTSGKYISCHMDKGTQILFGGQPCAALDHPPCKDMVTSSPSAHAWTRHTRHRATHDVCTDTCLLEQVLHWNGIAPTWWFICIIIRSLDFSDRSFVCAPWYFMHTRPNHRLL